MPIYTPKRTCIVIIILASLLTSSCGDASSSDKSSWTDIFKVIMWVINDITTPEMSTEEAKQIFSKHFTLMESVVDLCVQYPVIRRVEIETTNFHKGTPPSDRDALNSAVEKIRKSIATIKASAVVCYRDIDNGKNLLSIVSFVIYSVGLSVSGAVKSIDFDTEWQRQHRVFSEEERLKQGVTPLNKPGWSLYESSKE